MIGLTRVVAWLEMENDVDQGSKNKEEHVLTAVQINVRRKTRNAVFRVVKPEQPYQHVLVSILKQIT